MRLRLAELDQVIRFATVAPVTATRTRPLRIDAERNRERIVAAARELIAAEGVDVPGREVARHAKVGVATFHRHFPDRAALIDAVLEDVFDEFVAIGERAVLAPDAWLGFTGFLEEALRLFDRNRGLRAVVEAQRHSRERTVAMRNRLRPLYATLVARAHAEGTLRRDFTATDIPLLIWASARIIELAEDVAPAAWQRHLGLVIDGLRQGAARPLPEPPLTDAQLLRIGAKAGRR
jgi:AcrR family transcriptional regulator